MSDTDQAEPKRQAVGKKPTGSLDSFLKTVTEGYEAAYAEALAAVEAARQTLADAEAQLAKVEAYNPNKPAVVITPTPTRTRQVGTGSGTRAPRGEWPAKILELIGRHPDGLSRGQIIDQLGQKGIKAGESSISNSLVALKKGEKVGYVNGLYTPL